WDHDIKIFTCNPNARPWSFIRVHSANDVPGYYFLSKCSEIMDSSHIVDVQFNRAVEIVQGLPKTGPIQTGYEEKLTMYRYVETTLLSLILTRVIIYCEQSL